MKKLQLILIALATFFSMAQLIACGTPPTGPSEQGAKYASLTGETTTGGAATGETSTDTSTTTGTTATGTTTSTSPKPTQLTCKEQLQEATLDLRKLRSGLTDPKKIAAPNTTALKCYCCPGQTPASGNCNPIPCELKCVFGYAASCPDDHHLIQLDGQFHCAPSGT